MSTPSIEATRQVCRMTCRWMNALLRESRRSLARSSPAGPRAFRKPLFRRELFERVARFLPVGAQLFPFADRALVFGARLVERGFGVFPRHGSHLALGVGPGESLLEL